MAPLKLQYMQHTFSFLKYLPCLKRHGSIEALPCPVSILCSLYLTMSEKTWLHWSVVMRNAMKSDSKPYHVWKDMAPLKRQHRATRPGWSGWLTMSEKTWLHWSNRHESKGWILSFNLPCLKRHGSIEAALCPPGRRLVRPYHVWKDMAPLKHLIIHFRFFFGHPYHVWKDMAPLKPLVSITASLMFSLLTMSEKTWLHWSLETIFLLISPINSYHVWKDMAPLKLLFNLGLSQNYHDLPCLKRHGSIEARSAFSSS